MSRRALPPIRLDISGLNPHIFDLCRQNAQTLVGSRKGRSISQDDNYFSNLRGDLASIPREDLLMYNSVVSIAIDFERAYGRSVTIRISEHSPNRFVDLFGKKRKDQSLRERVAFFVNGTKVYSGVPNSFSELDEAVEKAFGRKTETY
ncbi:MAG: hypothetical protein ACRECH_10965 [Nitrososphaerales archaeon]